MAVVVAVMSMHLLNYLPENNMTIETMSLENMTATMTIETMVIDAAMDGEGFTHSLKAEEFKQALKGSGYPTTYHNVAALEHAIRHIAYSVELGQTVDWAQEVCSLQNILNEYRPFAFISRHTPTQEQHALAEAQGIRLIEVGDMDAFSISASEVCDLLIDHGPIWTCGVIVVHPAAALRLIRHMDVGVFRNENRAEEGEKPTFHAAELEIYRRVCDPYTD